MTYWSNSGEQSNLVILVSQDRHMQQTQKRPPPPRGHLSTAYLPLLQRSSISHEPNTSVPKIIERLPREARTRRAATPLHEQREQIQNQIHRVRLRSLPERLHRHGNRHRKPNLLDHPAERAGRERAGPNEFHVGLLRRPDEAVVLLRDNERFDDFSAEDGVLQVVSQKIEGEELAIVFGGVSVEDAVGV
jgi:hypothetical protein